MVLDGVGVFPRAVMVTWRSTPLVVLLDIAHKNKNGAENEETDDHEEIDDNVSSITVGR